MTFLKRFGEIALKCIAIAGGFAPLVQAAVPDSAKPTVALVASDLALVADIITKTEVMGQALGIAGPDKLKAAAPLVAQIILSSSVLAQHEIANPALFQQGCASVASGMADVLNSLKDKVETVNKA